MSSPWWLPWWIALGAVAGALCRHYLIVGLAARWGTHFPWGTLLVNLSGSFLMGFCASVLKQPLSWAHGLVTVGFLGSYTTFSTYTLDTSRLWRQKRYGTALVYCLGSAVGGLLGAELGIALAQWRLFG
ncbi:fluoride efflux transporter CrcB [Gloeomargarita sp.]